MSELLKTELIRDIRNELRKKFPTYYNDFPDSFITDVIVDVMSASDYPKYNEDDISLAIQRLVLWYINNEERSGSHEQHNE